MAPSRDRQRCGSARCTLSAHKSRYKYILTANYAVGTLVHDFVKHGFLRRKRYFHYFGENFVVEVTNRQKRECYKSFIDLLNCNVQLHCLTIKARSTGLQEIQPL